MHIQKIAVFCSSSSKTPINYLNAAYEIGKWCALHQVVVLYGGGSIGEMGALANGVLDFKGKIIGIIPDFMMKLEWGNSRISEMIVTNNLSERKDILINQADAIIALPGGTGTLDEIADALSRKKLGIINIPIVLVNINGFFDHFLAFIQRMANDELIHREHLSYYMASTDISYIFDYFEKYIPTKKNSTQSNAAI